MQWALRLIQVVDVSPNPDFTSILNVDGKIFSITHYESPSPGVAYLTELEQDSDGKLTVNGRLFALHFPNLRKTHA